MLVNEYGISRQTQYVIIISIDVYCALFEILFVLVVFVQRNMNVVRTNTAISPMLILHVMQRSYSPSKSRKRKIDSTRCIHLSAM